MKLGKSRHKQLLVCIWNNYSFRGQTTIRFVCEPLLVRTPNNYWFEDKPIVLSSLTSLNPFDNAPKGECR